MTMFDMVGDQFGCISDLDSVVFLDVFGCRHFAALHPEVGWGPPGGGCVVDCVSVVSMAEPGNQLGIHKISPQRSSYIICSRKLPIASEIPVGQLAHA